MSRILSVFEIFSYKKIIYVISLFLFINQAYADYFYLRDFPQHVFDGNGQWSDVANDAHVAAYSHLSPSTGAGLKIVVDHCPATTSPVINVDAWCSFNIGDLGTSANDEIFFVGTSIIDCFDTQILDPVTNICSPRVTPPVETVANKGSCNICPTETNPINAATGNKYQRESDYVSPVSNGVRLERYYNSQATELKPGIFGRHWRSTYNRTVEETVDAMTSETVIVNYRPDGQGVFFVDNAGVWTPTVDLTLQLVELKDGQGLRTGWELTTSDNNVEAYDVNGFLISITDLRGLAQTLEYNLTAAQGGDDSPYTLDKVTDPFGRILSFNYAVNGLLATLTDPAGKIYSYAYDARNNLSTVIYPDETPADNNDNPTRIYHYEDINFDRALTGITDETGNRFASWGYDAQGRAIFSEHANGAERADVVYNGDGTTTITNVLGQVRTYHFETHNSVHVTSQIDGGQCVSCGGTTQKRTFDANGFVASRTDFNGNQTTFINDSRGLEISRTEAVGTPEERTITTEWHTTFRLPTKIIEPGKETTFTYDSAGRLLTRTETDTVTLATRTTTNTYNAQGLIASIDGPRTDVSDMTTFTYDAAGNLTATTNALGQVTQITAHDAHGRPLTLIDPNGTVTTLSYDPRGRLLTRTVNNQTTIFDYDGVGNITRTTLPNGSFLMNTYDAAQRLTAVDDNLGNRIEYTLDSLGNRTKEDVKDPLGILTRTLSRTYNSLNRLIETIGGASQSTTFTYDPNGNQTTITVDPTGLNQQTLQAFDGLNRLMTTTDANTGITTFTYDARDNLTSVTDAEGLTTSYTYDGLDNLVSQTSPDTGTTTFTYDAAGNRLTQTDARNVTSTFTYGVLNRLTNISYPDITQNVSFSYDTCSNGIGRLCQMDDESGTTTFAYDGRGNLTSQTTTMDSITKTTGYVYNGVDQLIQITYPSGRTVDYTRNVLGQIDSVTTTQGGITNTLASGLAYQPFGPLSGFDYGNGITQARSYDLDYRLSSLTSTNVQDLSYGLDNANNITNITNNLDVTRSQTLSYDSLNRLTDATGIYGNLNDSYDAIGNRLSETLDTHPETYTYDTLSHHLLQTVNGGTRSFSYDANGNTLSNTDRDFVYGDNNRLKEAQVLGAALATYTYNGRGERVKKADSTTTYYYYDQAGQLIAELDGQGNPLKEYVYLDGTPLALLSDNAAPTPGPIQIDGISSDWIAADRLDTTPLYAAIQGLTLYSRIENNTLYVAIQSSGSAIGPSTTVWLDTDLNTQTGHLVWGTAVGAEYNINVFTDGTPHLYTGADGQTWQQGPLSHAYNTGNTFLELAVPLSAIGQPSALNLFMDLNNTVFWPADYTTAGYRVNPRSTNGNPAIDGQFSDWGPADLLATHADGFQLYGRSLNDVVFLAIKSDGTPINPGTTIWLNTDQNPATGHLVWGFATGAEYNINVFTDGTPHLYTGADGQTWQQGPLVHAYNGTNTLLEIAVPREALNLTGTALDLMADINNVSFLPTDYTQPGFTLDASPTPPAIVTQQNYIHTDHLGTPQQITDQSQQVVWEATYTPFGEATITTELVTNNIRLPGQYWDAETGLHHNGFRTYDPSTGRYLQSDPIGLRGGFNTYLYVGANPLVRTDPTGLIVKWTGNLISIGGTASIGGQLSRFEFTSECKCNKVVKVVGFASFLTIGASATFGGGIGGSGSVQELFANFSDCPDASDFNGTAFTSGINSVFGAGASFFPSLSLGSVSSEPKWAAGPVFGIDVGAIYSIFGFSAVTSSTETTESCCG